MAFRFGGRSGAMEKDRDKRIVAALKERGLSHEHAMIAMGAVCEESMRAYQDGYDKAWNDCVAKFRKEKEDDVKKKKKFECVLCGCETKGITVHDFKFDKARTDVDWQLCPNHSLTWLLRRLEPEQVEKVRSIAGCETFHTHGDFYDAEGYSVQPV